MGTPHPSPVGRASARHPPKANWASAPVLRSAERPDTRATRARHAVIFCLAVAWFSTQWRTTGNAERQWTTPARGTVLAMLVLKMSSEHCNEWRLGAHTFECRMCPNNGEAPLRRHWALRVRCTPAVRPRCRAALRNNQGQPLVGTAGMDHARRSNTHTTGLIDQFGARHNLRPTRLLESPRNSTDRILAYRSPAMARQWSKHWDQKRRAPNTAPARRY